MSPTGLPAGFGLVLDPRLRRLDGGRVLIGGSPPRLIRLSDAGSRAVDRLGAGGAVPGGATGTAELARRLVDAGMAHPRPPRPATPAAPAPVSVVIPVRDRPAGLARALAGVGAVAELVVVDDGSSDAGPTAAVAAAAGARLLRNERPLGPAAARNRGLRETTAPVVAFVDSDCELETGWLDGLLPHLADPATGLVAPRVASAAASGDGVLARYERTGSPLDMGTREAAVGAGSAVPYVPAAVLVVRREAALAVGGFDEAMRTGEDVDFVWRLAAAGWAARYEPAVVARHAPRTRLDGWMRQRLAYGASAAALARRHPGRLAALGLHPTSALAWGLLLTGRPVAAAVSAAAATARLAGRLDPVERPWHEAVRLAAAGHRATAEVLATQLVRTWWPASLLVAAMRPRARRPLAAAALLGALLDWARRRPDLDPVRHCALHLLDASAYGAGVWAGCARERTVDPLLLRLER